jgi:3-oxoacyl-[acyl-carrier protein] reductase
VITGGSAGLGLAVARALTAEGVAVGLIARNEARLAKAAETIRAAVPDAAIVVAPADVSESAQLSAAVEAIVSQLGGLQLVVANAGGTIGGDLLTGTPADYAATFALNAGHAAALVRAAHPYLAASNDSSVVIVSSVTGVRPGPSSSYCR